MKLDERRETKDERVSHPERSEGSMHLRVILNSPVSTGLTPRHCEGVVNLPRAKRGGGNPGRA